jgi:hypothetical protein
MATTYTITKHKDIPTYYIDPIAVFLPDAIILNSFVDTIPLFIECER